MSEEETKISGKTKISKKALQDLYIKKGLSTRQCGKELNVHFTKIQKLLKDYGIKARPSGFQKGNKVAAKNRGKQAAGWRGGKLKKLCIDCGAEFEVFPSQDKAYVRCPGCRGKGRWGKDGRHKYVECAWCGKKKRVKLSEIQNNKTGFFYCSRKCYSKWFSESVTGEKNPRYKEKVKVHCDNCGKEKNVFPCHDEEYDKHFCDSKCYGEWRSKNLMGANNPKWIGGPEVCGFDAYAEKISFAEDVRRNPEDKNILQVKCAYCGRWFSPSQKQMAQRIRVLFGQKGATGESRFYCSERCKSACPIFRKIWHPEGFSKKAQLATSREVQAQLRQMVLKIDNWACQKCGRTIDNSELHCHHITGVEQNPIESADTDNCITLCKRCHKWAHTAKGCRYYDLKCENGLR